MNRKERILRLSAGRFHLGILMDWFDAFEDWENYLKAGVIFHAYDKLLKEQLKERNK
jgi:hypothetical protein